MSKDYEFLKDFTISELREIVKEIGVDGKNLKKSDLISILKNGFKKYGLPDGGKKLKEEKEEKENEYIILDEIGYKGKEGTVYAVKKKGGKKVYVMKQFKKNIELLNYK